MPNYNQTLQTNNSSLEEIITQLNNMPDAGSGGVDTSDATATSGDILSGKTAYVDGEKVTGTIATVSQATPAITINSATGLITATATQSAGYVVAGMKSGTKQLAFQAAQTITPGTTNKTIAANTYLGGVQTIKGDANLVPSNIVSGKSIFGVVGTATAGGGSGDTSVEDSMVTRTISGTYTNDRVTDIGKFALAGANLTRVSFPVCTSIGSNAFYCCSNLISANFPVCTTVGESAFAGCSRLTSVSFPVCTTIGSAAFHICHILRTANFPSCTALRDFAFDGCHELRTISFPVCTTIGNSAFDGCSSLTTVSFPKAMAIGSYAFQNCLRLTSVSFPACTSINNYAFDDCSSLTTVSFPVCTTIGNSAFQRCSSLTSVSFPKATAIGYSAFANCSKLTTASFPACTSIGGYAFQSCSSLTTVSFPKATDIGNSAFRSCSSLTSVSFPACTSIGVDAFAGCTKLSTIYLTASSVCKLSKSNAFSYTSIWSTKGSIFVPTSLVTAYKSATNWTYFSNRIFGV